MKRFLDWLFGPAAQPLELYYRSVVSRTREKDGDHIELSCGHHILLRHHNRASFPCEECLEAAQKRAADIGRLEGGK